MGRPRIRGDGRPLPERLSREIDREIERLALVQQQIVEVVLGPYCRVQVRR